MLNVFMPLHPKLVHFPIALFATALIFELLGRFCKKELISQAAVLIYVFAAVFTPMVVLSGLAEQARLHLNHPFMTQHKNLGLLTLGIALSSLPVLWWCHKNLPKFFPNIFLLVLIAVTTTVLLTSHFGGKMVYDYAVGVNL